MTGWWKLGGDSAGCWVSRTAIVGRVFHRTGEWKLWNFPWGSAVGQRGLASREAQHGAAESASQVGGKDGGVAGRTGDGFPADAERPARLERDRGALLEGAVQERGPAGELRDDDR